MRTAVRCLTGFLLAAAGTGVAAACAHADSSFLWSAPAAISPAETYISGVSCLSTPLCVAVDDTGNVLTSTSPTQEASSWRLTHVTGVAPDAVSCVAPQFCVAVDHAGSVFSSTNAAAEPPTWTVAQNVDPTGGISAVSCVSTSFCVAVDYHGNVLSSTSPTGGPSAWTATKVDRNPRSPGGANAMYGVSCPSTSLCIAVDSAGNVLVSTNPAAATPVWTVRNVEGNVTIYGVSCPSASLCVAADGGGNVLTSTDPTSESASAWLVDYRVDTHQLYGVSCVLPSTCVAVDAAGNVVTSTAPTKGGSAWTVASVDGIRNQLNSVSCASPQRCTAVDSAGNVIVGNPAPPRTPSAEPGAGPRPAGPGAPGGGAPAPRATNLTVAGWIVSLPTGVGMPLRCWAKTGSCATATLTLSIVEKLRGKRFAGRHHARMKRRRVIVGSTTVTLAAGQTETVDVMLNGAGRRRLNSLHRLSAQLRITSAQGAVLWRQTVGFFQRTKRKHR
jgi:photosystem II stability/assembly factor-like uncharacterized protein